MSTDQDISQNSRKAKHHGPDARLSDRNRRETGLISYHRAILRNLTAYFALGGVIDGLRPNGIKLTLEFLLYQLLTQCLPGFNHKRKALGPPLLDARLHPMGANRDNHQCH
jgi:hypothetical protein